MASAAADVMTTAHVLALIRKRKRIIGLSAGVHEADAGASQLHSRPDSDPRPWLHLARVVGCADASMRRSRRAMSSHDEGPHRGGGGLV